MNKSPRTQTWKPTKIPNLFLLVESGIYYGRVKPKGGKQIRKSLETSSFEVAKERLREWLLTLQIAQASTGGTWADVHDPYTAWLQGEKIKEEVTDSTIAYKQELIASIRSTWQSFDTFQLTQLTDKIFSDWIVAHRAKYSATRTNGATTVLREMTDVAVKNDLLAKHIAATSLPGLRYVKVKYDYKRHLNNLPEPPEIVGLRCEVQNRCQKAGSRGYWLFDFLLFSGCRIESAGEVRWVDIKWDANNG